MELLGDVGCVESCFGLFRDGVSLWHKIGAWLAPTVPQAQKSFWTSPMVLLSDEAPVKAISVRLEIVLILTQDRCTVFAKRTIGSEIIMDTPDGTPR
jgi:hypothetical protein